MGEINMRNGQNIASSKFLYIEPNERFGEDINSSVPLEDLSIYVDLSVEYQRKKTSYLKNTNISFRYSAADSGTNISFRYSAADSGTNISFTKGSNMGTKNDPDYMLSTLGYDNYTLKDIKNKGTHELFGIESINISYNSFMVPEVEIKFVDIKGAALHGAEELAHGNDGEYLGQEVSEEIKFLSCFFTVPYPHFQLTVKGFYGKPVHYDLSCAEFRSAFECKTGNYTATAKMVGYAYGLISDVSICSLMAAPYSNYYGRRYWKEQTTNGRFCFEDGTPFMTFSEMVSTWYHKMGEINGGDIEDAENNGDEQIRQQINDLTQHINQKIAALSAIKNYLAYVASEHERVDKIDSPAGKIIKEIHFENDHSTLVMLSHDLEIRTDIVGIDDAGDEYIKNIKELLGDNYFNWNDLKGKQSWLWGAKNTVHNRTIHDMVRIVKEMKTKEYSYNANKYLDKVLNLMTCGKYYYMDVAALHLIEVDFSKIVTKINSDIERDMLQIHNLQNGYKNEINSKLIKILGFLPTIENISKICFAHLETFLFMYHCVRQQRSRGTGNNVIDSLGLFPEMRVSKTANSKTTNEEEWIGRNFPNLEEVMMTRGMISGIEDVLSDDNLPVGVTPEELGFNVVAPCDVVRSKNPFSVCGDEGLLTDDIMINRLVDLFVMGITRVNVNPVLMAQFDAQNYASLYPKPNETLTQQILSFYWKTQFANKFFRQLWLSDSEEWKKIFSSYFYHISQIGKDWEQIIKNKINDTGFEYFKIYSNHELDGSRMVSTIKGKDDSDFITIDTTEGNGWTKNEVESCFRFQWYINSATAYVVGRAASQDDVAKVPYHFVRHDNDEEKKAASPNNDIFNYYIHTDDKNKTYLIQRSKGDDAEKYFEASDTADGVDEVVTLKEELKSWDETSNCSNWRTLTCMNTMSEMTHTILTIPDCRLTDISLDDLKKYASVENTLCISCVLSNGTLFTKDYYKGSDIKLKAFYFLMTFTWGRDYISTDEKEDTTSWINEHGTKIGDANSGYTEYRCNLLKYNAIHFSHVVDRCLMYNVWGAVDSEDFRYLESVPLFFILKLGAILYGADDSNFQDSRFWYIYDKYLGKGTKNMRAHYKKYLKDFFINWVNTTYKKWDDVFMAAENDKEDKKENKELYYLCYFTYKSVYLKIFRETHPIVQELNKQFFKLVVWYKYNYGITSSNDAAESLTSVYQYVTKNAYFAMYVGGDKMPSRAVCDKIFVDDYLKAFNDALEYIYNKELETKRNELLNLPTVDEQLALTTYIYLRQIWDRWVINEKYNGFEQWQMHKVFDEDEGRIHFIDSSYNKIGDLLLIDLAKFIELLETCREDAHMNLPFLTFLSYFYRDNHCALYNIQNFYNNQNEENVRRIFDPIPYTEVDWDGIKRWSDLIVMFTYQLAEGTDDSFNIDDTDSLPPQLKELVNGNLKVPAIGVTYGSQNQNYFIDINVSMNTPNVTEQSLQAVMQIAEENSQKAASDSSMKLRTYGQDMWQVFGNHAYECTVRMMGCAWIQPLMYFQLTNVPLFRGAYIIQKVQHSIQAGQMYTTFSGMRISSKTSKQMEKMSVEGLADLKSTRQQIDESQEASTFNNCPYAFYNPLGDDDISDDKFLNDTLFYFNSVITGTSDYEGFEEMTRKKEIAIKLCYTAERLQNGGEKNVLCLTFIVLLRNYWVRWREIYNNNIGNLFTRFFAEYGTVFYDIWGHLNMYKSWIINEGNEEWVKNIIKNLEKCFKQGNAAIVSNWPDMDYVDGLIETSTNEDGKYVIVPNRTLNNVYQFIKGAYGNVQAYGGAFYESKKSSSITIDNLIEAFNKTMSDTLVLKRAKLELYKQVIVNNVNYALLQTNLDDGSSEIYGSIFDMILQTYADQYLISLSWIVSDENSGHNIWDYIMISFSPNGGQSFSKVEVAYVKEEADLTTEPIKSYDNFNLYYYASLMKKFKITRQFKFSAFDRVDTSFKLKCSTNFEEKLSDDGNWSRNILDFFSTNDITSDILIEECFGNRVAGGTGGMDGDAQLTEEEISGKISGYEGFQFEGYYGDKHMLGHMNQLEWTEDLANNGNTSTVAANVVSEEENMETFLLRNGFVPRSTYDGDETIHGTEEMANRMKRLGVYAKEHSEETGSSSCAKYVRQALEGCLKFNTEGCPDCASRYAQILNYWGFTIVYEGMTNEFNDFKNGDIIVTAGLDVPEKDANDKDIYYTYKSGKQKTNRHMRMGHIQIFYNGKWYCDRPYSSANVYAGEGDRPSFVFRGIDSDGITIQSNSGNGYGLRVENGKVYWGDEYLYDEGWDWQPSESIKAKIKEFEGWHGSVEGTTKKPGWVKCPSGHWTTGWGFKETVRLRNDYPNGMDEDQANNYFEEVAVPERVRELKRVMKDMMFYKQHQMDALFDLLYNVGGGHFTTSKSPNMMSALSVRNLQNAARNMDHGIKSGLPGLVTRREYDQNLFLNGNY